MPASTSSGEFVQLRASAAGWQAVRHTESQMGAFVTQMSALARSCDIYQCILHLASRPHHVRPIRSTVQARRVCNDNNAANALPCASAVDQSCCALLFWMLLECLIQQPLTLGTPCAVGSRNIYRH